jgi:glucose-6-phosphate 1-epimerase
MDQLVLTASDGAQMGFVKQGAHLCSWIPAGGTQQLFLSQSSEFCEGAAIRGGVPIVFPQFSGFGVLPKHGFARTADWELLRSGQTEQGAAQAVFTLQENIARLHIWPHVFHCQFTATALANSLQLVFEVNNTGDTAFSFTTALHTYFRVDDIAQTQIYGLGGLAYRDTVSGQSDCVQEDTVLRVEGEIDRIYTDVNQAILIQQAQQVCEIQQSGFADAVVWNPGAEKGAQLSDLEVDGYQRMVCVEAANIARPVHLLPGQSWSGCQTMRILGS